MNTTTNNIEQQNERYENDLVTHRVYFIHFLIHVEILLPYIANMITINHFAKMNYIHRAQMIIIFI